MLTLVQYVHQNLFWPRLAKFPCAGSGIVNVQSGSPYSVVVSLLIRNLSFLDWRDLSLDLGAEEIVAIMGDSGSGKSLFLRAIADLILSEGTVEHFGKSREEFEPIDWRKKVGFLPAEIFWWEDRVVDHFEKSPPADWMKRLSLEEGSLDWQPQRLSMGERQRLGLLRMLDRRPKVLLLDEPTANLNESATESVESLILEYITRNEASALWVTHSDQQASRVASKRYRMRNKQLQKF